ncbi:MAG: hypothetical protein ACI4CS_08130 [Candidatus Weimeria sp.]
MSTYTYVFPLMGYNYAKEMLEKSGYEVKQDGSVPQRITTDCPPKEFQENFNRYMGDQGTDAGEGGVMDTIPRSKTHSLSDIRKVFREEYRGHCTKVLLETEE